MIISFLYEIYSFKYLYRNYVNNINIKCKFIKLYIFQEKYDIADVSFNIIYFYKTKNNILFI